MEYGGIPGFCYFLGCDVLVKDSKPYINAAATGIAANLLLFLVKLYVGISTNSISIYVDSLNNAADSVVCLIALVGFSLAVKTSADYPFGLGRAEDLTGFITAVVILITGAAFAYVSMERILYPAPVWFSIKYACLIGTTAAVKLALGFYYRQKNKRHASPVLQGLWLDSLLDFFITLATIMSFTLTAVLEYPVDGYFGLAISLLLLVSGVRSCAASFACLLGRRDNAACSAAQALLERDDEVAEVLNVQCHKYGRRRAFSADLAVSCTQAAQVVELENRLCRQFCSELSADLSVHITKIIN